MPEKEEWSAVPLHETVKFQRRTAEHPASIYFLAVITYPERHKGRIVRIEYRHELMIGAFVQLLIQQMREQGHRLPDSMG